MDEPSFSGSGSNRILDALDADADAALRRVLRPVKLEQRGYLHRSGERMRDVFFPTRGAVSAVRLLADGSVVEVATIGAEGMAGASLFQPRQGSELDMLCQVDGDALSMSVENFLAIKAEFASFRLRIDCYTNAFVTQIAQIAACNTTHRVVERTCVWLLIAADRFGEGPVPERPAWSTVRGARAHGRADSDQVNRPGLPCPGL